MTGAPGAVGALGNLTKSASAPSQADATRATVRRWERWRLHEAVGDLLPGSRPAKCGHQAAPDRMVSLRLDANGNGYYAGTRACGSVWHCPFCAAKVGRARVLELRRAVDAARDQGYTVTLATFTLGHKATDYLGTLLSELTEAMRWWRSGRWWAGGRATVGMAERLGYVGSIRNLEVTWGEATGWHPHSHALLITRGPISVAHAAELRERWALAVERQGGYASADVGLHLTDADNEVAGYLSKVERELAAAEGKAIMATDERRGWGAAEELVWSHVKDGRGERYSPWALLRLLLGTGWAVAADKWVEYAAAFHGKRQLYWSRGLRELLGLGAEVSDQELAEAEGESEVVVTVFATDEWRRLVKEGRRLELLMVLQVQGLEAAHAWLREWRSAERARARVALEANRWHPDWAA